VSEQFALEMPLRALSRATDPDTSRAAAARVDAKGLALRVLEELRKNGPGTSHELAARMNLDLVTVSPRLKPLEDAKHVRRDGRRDGRTVWAAT
jgi:DNA-binding MarR family transcriptional regulator